MIASALSIKILGCALGISITVGIPLIVRDVRAKRQIIVDKHDNVEKFLLNHDSSDIYEGESFSNEAFKKDWVPEKEQEKNIADNWSTIIQKVPSNFFTPYLVSFSESKSALQEPGVCYLQTKISNIKNQPAGENAKHLYIPVPQEKIKEKKPIKRISNELWINGELAWDKMAPNTWDSNFQSLKTMSETQNFNFTTLNKEGEIQTMKNLKTNQHWDKNTAEDILFFEEIYKATSKRLHELGYELPTADVWEYEQKTCNPKISQ